MSNSSSAAKAISYYQSLSENLLNMRITDKDSNVLSMDEGIDQALSLFESVKPNGRKIMLVGNGGSASIASHLTIDFWKVAGFPAIAFNDPVQLTCLSNDCGYENVFSTAIEMFGQEGDVLVAISSAGRSANILNAAKIAAKKGISVVTFAGFSSEAPLLSLGDLNFFINSTQYGQVEIAHLTILHHMADELCLKGQALESTKRSNSLTDSPELQKKLFSAVSEVNKELTTHQIK